MGAYQYSLRGRRGPRKPRLEIAEFDCPPVRRLLREALLAGLPTETGQTVDKVLANLPVGVAPGRPGTKISKRFGFRQRLLTVKIGPDFLSVRRRPSGG